MSDLVNKPEDTIPCITAHMNDSYAFGCASTEQYEKHYLCKCKNKGVDLYDRQQLISQLGNLTNSCKLFFDFSYPISRAVF